MFVELLQKLRIEMEHGKEPALRAVFRKQHGIAYGQFKINPDIETKFKQGIFANDSYGCVVRFSSDIAPTEPDLLSTLGFGLKLFGVKGEKLLGKVTPPISFSKTWTVFSPPLRSKCVHLQQQA